MSAFTSSSLLGDLIYINYSSNRDACPDTPVENWARIYPNAEALEARYQAEKAIDKASAA